MKLIKIKEHYYVVEEKKILGQGKCEWYIDKYLMKPYNSGGAEYEGLQLVITHSTEQLEGVTKLDYSSVEEALYGYSIDSVAKKHNINDLEDDVDGYGFIMGYHAYKELVKDKFILTKVQVEDALFAALNTIVCQHTAPFTNNNVYSLKETKDNIVRNIIKEHLLPKTEWEVTIDENNKISLVLKM